MMGNDHSQLTGLEIEDKPIEITDFWCHFQAKIKDSCRYFSLKSDGSVSVFKGSSVTGPLWAISTPLEKFSNNLLKYRHPNIVRYISAWQQRSIFHLTTEFVLPLTLVIDSLNSLQICIGLNDILQALVFLHDQAGMSHNNISTSAVYVTGDGHWKLGGLQYLCSFNELSASYMKQTRIHRYDKAIDPNEDSHEIMTKVDQYAFAVLVEDVFTGHDDEVPHFHDFKKYCRDRLQHSEPTMRPDLSQVTQHNFFNHEFIVIYKFMNNLPLKTDEEKSQFFTSILDSLKSYDEETVAKQLGGLLLSRITMLDPTARKDVIPYILKPAKDRVQSEEYNGFFSLSVYKEHIKPRLLQLFGVRDNHIRLLLLTHFSKYVHVFTHEELSQHILPELLLGIKDTDDNLVASTLICLSELVPILGANLVVGGKRTKLFTDGRPNVKHKSIPSSSRKHEEKASIKTLRDFQCSDDVYKQKAFCSHMFDRSSTYDERPSPVGGESVENDTNEVNKNDETDGEWSDWDETNQSTSITNNAQDPNLVKGTSSYNITTMNSGEENYSATQLILTQSTADEARKKILDISELDIKSQKFTNSKKSTDEFDFFADMMPVIEKPSVANIIDVSNNFSSKLIFTPNENEFEEGNEGWGDNWEE